MGSFLSLSSYRSGVPTETGTTCDLRTAVGPGPLSALHPSQKTRQLRKEGKKDSALGWFPRILTPILPHNYHYLGLLWWLRQ